MPPFSEIASMKFIYEGEPAVLLQSDAADSKDMTFMFDGEPFVICPIANISNQMINFVWGR